jgi:adenosine deaminase
VQEQEERARTTRELLQALPKTDLHLHLDGSLRPSTIFELAREQRVKLPVKNASELRRLIQRSLKGRTLPDYLRLFDITLRVLQEREALQRAAYELAMDCATEGVRYCEVRYCPLLHTKRALMLPEIVDAVLLGLKRAEQACGIKTGVIICGMRNISPRFSEALAELTVAYKQKGVVAFDLAGAEKDYPAKHHQAAYRIIIENNINSTVHAGEAFGPPSIAQALHHCGAHRLGHGTRLREDRELLDYVNDHRIPLEICVTSNVQTGAVPRLRDHPVRFYYDYGLRVTLNTDNRLMSDTNSTGEFVTACRAFGFTPEEVRNIIINGFKSAFLPLHEKVTLLRAAITDMDRLMAAYRKTFDPALPML